MGSRKPTNLVKEWIELAEGCLVDGPPLSRDYTYYLFINHCRVKRLPSGRLVLERRTGCQTLSACSKRGVIGQVREFVNRNDVRLLVKDLESNDFDRLPKRQLDVPRDVVSGKAEIYQ